MSARRPASPTATGRPRRACRSIGTSTTSAATRLTSAARTGFTFTVLEPVTGDVIGCVYLYPSELPDTDVTVQSWVRVSHAELDVPLADAVAAWLAAEWPWEHVHRPGR